MASITVKSTYSLDLETIRQLESLAKRWNTSKSGALRRAIRHAAREAPPIDREGLDALDRLQELLALDRRAAAGWEARVKRERRTGAGRTHRSAPP